VYVHGCLEMRGDNHGDVQMHQECVGTHREVSEVSLEVREGSMDAHRFAGRFWGCTDVCREVSGCSGDAWICMEMCGECGKAGSGLNSNLPPVSDTEIGDFSRIQQSLTSLTEE
jgi:hypothetical protein